MPRNLFLSARYKLAKCKLSFCCCSCQFVVIVAVVAVHVVVAVTARFTNQRFATLVEARSQSIQHDLSGSIIAIAVAVSVSVASSFSMEKHFHGKH